MIDPQTPIDPATLDVHALRARFWRGATLRPSLDARREQATRASSISRSDERRAMIAKAALLAGYGLTNQQIATYFDVSYDTVWRWLREQHQEGEAVA